MSSDRQARAERRACRRESSRRPTTTASCAKFANFSRPHGVEAVGAADSVSPSRRRPASRSGDNAALKAAGGGARVRRAGARRRFRALRRGARRRAGDLLRPMGGRGQGLRRRDGADRGGAARGRRAASRGGRISSACWRSPGRTAGSTRSRAGSTANWSFRRAGRRVSATTRSSGPTAMREPSAK